MIHNIGLTLTATEVRSTQKYWQVRQNVEDSEKRFPTIYTASVVGILWETALFFTTWFGNAPYLIYGIQLLPLTPISEARDNMNWAEEIYEPLAASCNALCISEGWSVQVYAILATIGRFQEAVENTLNLPSSVYEHAGGNGHSKSNTLWYIATRPYSTSPSNKKEFETIFEEDPFIEIFDNESDYDDDDDDEEKSDSNDNIFDDKSIGTSFKEDVNDKVIGLICSNPTKCTSQVLDTMAQGHSCRDRIQYLMDLLGKREIEACRQVAVDEYPEECGFCRPDV